MTSSQDIDTINSPNLDPDPSEEPSINPLDELPGEVEMSIFDHLEELRQRIFYSLIVVVVGIVGCFIVVKPLVQLLEVPAHGVKFLQLAPGEFFFVSMKVAAYGGLGEPYIMSSFGHFHTAYPEITNFLPILVWNGYSLPFYPGTTVGFFDIDTFATK